eukprot:2047375-Prymnesium_polylepis.1
MTALAALAALTTARRAAPLRRRCSAGPPTSPTPHPARALPPTRARRVRGVHNVNTAKAGSIFKLKFLTSP